VTDSTELLTLRIALLAVIFLFVLIAALTLRMGIRSGRAAAPARPVVASNAGPRLVLVSPGHSGLETGAVFSLAGEMSVGRDPGNSIVISDPSVSARHARLARARGGWEVVDLGSTNGTAVNGRPVDGRGRVLAPGDQVVVGAVVLRFQS
jgi:hypothetical protein